MPSPFPGMDPYLEDVALWTGVHAALIARIQDQLAQRLLPRYLVAFQERVYITAENDPAYRVIYPDVHFVQPDPVGDPMGSGAPATAADALAIAEPIRVTEDRVEPVRELSLELRDATDLSVVTVIEVLSRTNKVLGSEGRADFLRKRREIYATSTHWVELDLLRAGGRTAHRRPVVTAAYQAFVSRHLAERGERQGDLWPIPLDARLPVIGIPLRSGEPDAPLDLQAAFGLAYDRGGYRYRINYAADPPPPAMSADALAWCRATAAKAASGG